MLTSYLCTVFPCLLWLGEKGREQWELLVIAIKKTEKNKKINWGIPLAVSFPGGKFPCVYVTNLTACLVLPLPALLPSGITLMRIIWKLLVALRGVSAEGCSEVSFRWLGNIWPSPYPFKKRSPRCTLPLFGGGKALYVKGGSSGAWFFFFPLTFECMIFILLPNSL